MQCRRRVPIPWCVLILTLGFLVLVAAQASSPLAGTWRVNIAKSRYSPGPAPKSGSARYEVSQSGFKGTTDGVNAQGQTTHAEYTCSFDGRDCPYQVNTVDGKPNPDPNVSATTLSWKRIDDYTYEFTNKVKGQVTTTTRLVIAKDGKTQTRTTTGKNAQSQTVNNTAVYEKQ
jgi:hypothetical protein